MYANHRRKLSRSSDERSSAASGMPSLSESAQTAPSPPPPMDKDEVEDRAAAFALSALACGDFPQPNPAIVTVASAKDAQARIIRVVRLFGWRFIVLITDDKSLLMRAYYNRSAICN